MIGKWGFCICILMTLCTVHLHHLHLHQLLMLYKVSYHDNTYWAEFIQDHLMALPVLPTILSPFFVMLHRHGGGCSVRAVHGHQCIHVNACPCLLDLFDAPLLALSDEPHMLPPLPRSLSWCRCTFFKQFITCVLEVSNNIPMIPCIHPARNCEDVHPRPDERLALPLLMFLYLRYWQYHCMQ